MNIPRQIRIRDTTPPMTITQPANLPKDLR